MFDGISRGVVGAGTLRVEVGLREQREDPPPSSRDPFSGDSAPRSMKRVISATWAEEVNLRRGTCMLSLTATLAFLVPASALAQAAWLPGKGEARVGFMYQYLVGGKHLNSEPNLLGFDLGSKKVDLGSTYSQVVALDVDVGITDRFALTGTIAFVGSKYVVGGVALLGGPFGIYSPLDNGSWHGTFQDGRIGARFLALDDGAWALTPFVSYGLPTTDYNVIGHTSFGRGLTELQLGLHWGRILSSSGRPFGYIHGTASHAFMEDVGDISLSRTNVLLGFGYFFKSVTVNAWTLYQNIHGGIDWSRDLSLDGHHAEELGLAHDRAAASDFWRVGMGVSLPVSLGVDLYANIGTTLWGVNTHQAHTITVGATWNFQAFGGTDWWYE